jgi:hypothetical protein
VSAIDFFSATGRITVEGFLTDLEIRIADSKIQLEAEDSGVRKGSENLTAKAWVTRRGVHVHCIACAWMIRRFIDPKARFKFVSEKDYDAQPANSVSTCSRPSLRMKVICSFEAFLERLGLSDPALRSIAEIVHDIDLKDGKFGCEQTVGIAPVIAGICMSQRDDMATIGRGSAIFDDLYEYFRKKRGR